MRTCSRMGMGMGRLVVAMAIVMALLWEEVVVVVVLREWVRVRLLWLWGIRELETSSWFVYIRGYDADGLLLNSRVYHGMNAMN